jgi:hypothetical protein
MQLMDIHSSFVCFHTIESIGELNSGYQNYPFGRYVPHWRIIEWNDQCELCVKWENFHFSRLPLQKLLKPPFSMSRMWDIDHDFVKAASFFPLSFPPLMECLWSFWFLRFTSWLRSICFSCQIYQWRFGPSRYKVLFKINVHIFSSRRAQSTLDE